MLTLAGSHELWAGSTVFACNSSNGQNGVDQQWHASKTALRFHLMDIEGLLTACNVLMTLGPRA